MRRDARSAGLRRRPRCLLAVAVLSVSSTLLCPGAGTPASATSAPVPGPEPAYRCSFNVDTDAFTGADGTASAIGWLGDYNSVITCLGGTFVIQDGPAGLFQDDGFGIYAGQRMTWADADGYLPAQTTTFTIADGATVAITEFADRVVLSGAPFVAVYSRVRISNPTSRTITADPLASPALVPLRSAPNAVLPHHAVDHDYVVIADRFGSAAAWPSNEALLAAGGFTAHFAHMRAFWNAQLAGITQIAVPERSLVDAYKSGFITTQITRSGNDLDTGVNGYESEFSHDVVGILTNLFTQGSYGDAHALLTEARHVVGAPGQYVDGLWTYSVPWAVYLLKTGDKAFVEQNFATGGGGASEPSIEDAAHAIAADRTGPMGTMEATNDIDTQGYWTTDDFEALLGLAAYRFIASALGDASEASWASAAVRQPALRNERRARSDDQSGPPRLPALLAAAAQHRQPLRQSQGRQLDLADRELGLGSVAPRCPGQRSGPDDDRCHVHLWLRPPARVAATGHDGRIPGRLLLQRLQRRAGCRRAGQRGPSGPGHRELRVHDRQQSERTVVVVGELERPRPPISLGRPAPGDRPGLVSACLGHRRCRQGSARLPRGAAVERLTGRRPRRASRMARPWSADLRDAISPRPAATGSASASPHRAGRSR